MKIESGRYAGWDAISVLLDDPQYVYQEVQQSSFDDDEARKRRYALACAIRDFDQHAVIVSCTYCDEQACSCIFESGSYRQPQWWCSECVQKLGARGYIGARHFHSTMDLANILSPADKVVARTMIRNLARAKGLYPIRDYSVPN